MLLDSNSSSLLCYLVGLAGFTGGALFVLHIKPGQTSRGLTCFAESSQGRGGFLRLLSCEA